MRQGQPTSPVRPMAGSQRRSEILPASTENNQSSIGVRLVFDNKATAQYV